MLNVLFDDKNNYSVAGMKAVLEEVFPHPIRYGEFNAETVKSADIIVKNFIAGEIYICQSLLNTRKTNSILICMIECKPLDKKYTPLPYLADAIIVNKKDYVSKLKMSIQSHLFFKSPELKAVKRSCPSCCHGRYSQRQLEVVQRIYKGQSINYISLCLKISPKTVSSHKIKFMKTLKIFTTCDLISLLNKISNPDLFSNSCVKFNK